MADLSPEARARAERTIRVADVFAQQADHIAEAMAYVADGFVLVAVVDADHEFTGTHHVAAQDLVERVPELEGDGWAMVFYPGADADRVRTRTIELADIASQRIKLIDKILARRAQ